MVRVDEKQTAVAAIEKLLVNYSIQPDILNPYLESIGSAPLKQSVKMNGVLLRPKVTLADIAAHVPDFAEALAPYDEEARELAEINLKYEGYIRREQEMVDKMNRLESVRLHETLDYHELSSLSKEARAKLTQLKPRTIGQASRIRGVSPSDISVLLVHMGR
jgi:tRNA uridine 5-carboxymethylaminomethyl modification enzyme